MTAVINNIAVIMNTTMIPVGVPKMQLVKKYDKIIYYKYNSVI